MIRDLELRTHAAAEFLASPSHVARHGLLPVADGDDPLRVDLVTLDECLADGVGGDDDSSAPEAIRSVIGLPRNDRSKPEAHQIQERTGICRVANAEWNGLIRMVLKIAMPRLE